MEVTDLSARMTAPPNEDEMEQNPDWIRLRKVGRYNWALVHQD
jgi:hypothetical protein